MSQTGTLMGFVHRRRRGAELFLLVLALAVGIGAYAAVGLGVEGVVPADLVGYGGWLTALIVAAHVTVRLVAPYADPVLLPLVAALNGLGLAWVVLAAGWSWSQQQFYVADHDGKVAIFRGIDADLPGISLSHAYEVSDVDLDRLSDIEAETVLEGIAVDDLDQARLTVDNYAANQDLD